MNADEVTAFLDAAFPPATRSLLGEVQSLALNHLRMRLDPDPSMRRPGDIVSGPAIMALVDVAAYGVIAAHHGPEAMAVTHSLSITFLRACRFEPIIADAQILKLGRRLASVDVRIWQRTPERLIAQSTVGYSLP
ncbi:PaaI family thioesterase [Novosphingobium sp. H3SJ31-1]|uniref:PaaI family thioesterase n=1 Tax=Novosphingobium album (ex Liu et al. 2023) TaxID=3031130 RepID=A0ABT5WTW1_9SPHN|nr:PaaI family thioesterase [Novosphingobium album (ex Liu et al. 2023)]